MPIYGIHFFRLYLFNYKCETKTCYIKSTNSILQKISNNCTRYAKSSSRVEKRRDNVSEKREKHIGNNKLTKCNKRCPNKNKLSCCLFSSPMSHHNVPCSAHCTRESYFSTIFVIVIFLLLVNLSREQ